MAVTITGVELRRVSLPLVAPFRYSSDEIAGRDVLLVRVHTSAGEGWGECAAGGRPSYTSEYAEGAHHVLREHLVPLLLAAGLLGAQDLERVLGPVRGHRMAKAAVELAVLDAELRSRSQSLAAHLGATRTTVEASVAVGIMGSVAELADAVERHVEAGYRTVKLKIAPGWDVEPVGAVRSRVGDGIRIRVDANGAYRLSDAEQLAGLDHFGLELIEQPLPADALIDHARLAERLRTPIGLDESITSAGVAATAVALGAAACVNVKAARLGGLVEAVRVHDLCREAGVPVWCGGMLDTGIARAANLALAALPNFVLAADLSASERYFRPDLTEPFRLEDGELRVPQGPGLGVAVIGGLLEEATTSVELIAAG